MDTKQIRNVDISGIQHLSMISSIDSDFTIFNDTRDIPFTPYPIRLNAACLAVYRKGRCRTSINLQEYEMREGMLCTVLSERIVQQGERSDDFSDSFIVVSKDFMGAVMPTIQQLFPVSFMIKGRPYIKVTVGELQTFEEYHSLLQRKVKLEDNPYRKEIMQRLLLTLFYEIHDIYQGHTMEERAPKSRKEDLFEHFIWYVSEDYKEGRSVAYYTDKMLLALRYPSTVVKEVSSKTVGEWTDSLTILEAKVLLKSSGQSIQEITDELHLANQPFFGKYFKRHTGMSPEEYKKQQCERSLYNAGLNRWKSGVACSGSL